MTRTAETANPSAPDGGVLAHQALEHAIEDFWSQVPKPTDGNGSIAVRSP